MDDIGSPFVSCFFVRLVGVFSAMVDFLNNGNDISSIVAVLARKQNCAVREKTIGGLFVFQVVLGNSVPYKFIL